MEVQSSSPSSSTTSELYNVHDNEKSKPSTSPTARIFKKPESPEIEKKEILTIEKDFNVKHPLQNSWTLWYDNPGHKTNSKNWSQNLKQVLSFSTVEDFWSLWNNIRPSSQLISGSNYHFFKTGVEPKWEDPVNSKGGKWILQVSQKQRQKLLDQLWLFTVLAMIGEDFPESDKVCGAVVSVRKQQDKISLWTGDASDEVVTKRIGQKYKDLLGLPNISLGYQEHQEALRSSLSWSNKNKYEV